MNPDPKANPAPNPFVPAGAPRTRQLSFLPAERPLGERLGAEFFQSIPTGPGVYVLCGAGEGVLYVGKAKNLRQRLATYRSARPEGVSRKLAQLLMLVERIHWDLCADEASALLREAELLRTLKPRYNTAGKYPAPPRPIGWEIIPRRGMTLAWGPAAANCPHATDPLPGAGPGLAALRRLFWGAARPHEPLSALPTPLLSPQPGVSPWILSWPKVPADALGALVGAFFSAGSLELLDWLSAQRSDSTKFDQAWQAQDRELLAAWVERFPR